MPAPIWSLPVFARATRASRVSGAPCESRAVRRRAARLWTPTPRSRYSRPADLLGAGGGVDHNALPGARGADEYRQALRAGHGPQGLLLLAGEGAPMRSATSLLALVRACWPTSRPAGWASSRQRRSIACSCARTARVVIRPPSKVRTRRSRDHLPCDHQRLSGLISPAVCSSATVRSAPASKTACLFGQLRFDAILQRLHGRRVHGCADQMHRLISPEPVALTRPRPHPLQIAAGRELLGAAVLERQIAQLPAFGGAAVLGTETLRGLCDLAVAPENASRSPPGRPRSRSTGRPARPLLDRIALPRQLLRQRGAVKRPHLPGPRNTGGRRPRRCARPHAPRR